MPILNYTTSVPVNRTVNEVQNLLIKAGARQIMAEFGPRGTAIGMSFTVESPLGLQGYTLPVRSERVLAVLTRDKVERRYLNPEHAERVAWRILKDWVAAQLALLRTEMVTLDQVMLPYMRTEDGRTMYELYLDQRLALPAAEESA